jgi:thymidylate synthase (FAD)
MKVKLISLQQPTITTPNGQSMTAEDLVCYTARVSAPQNQDKLDTAPKLLKYLIENKHWSPLEMVNFCVEIQTSRAIAAQVLRHRSFVFQEFSQRYSVVSDYETYPARRQDIKNRQNSIDDMPKEDQEWFAEAQMQVWNNSIDLYNKSLEKGIAKEQARFLLPLNTKTTMFMNGSLRSWVHYLQLRSGNGTQKEHADIAHAIIRDVMIPTFPNVCKAIGWSE